MTRTNRRKLVSGSAPAPRPGRPHPPRCFWRHDGGAVLGKEFGAKVLFQQTDLVTDGGLPYIERGGSAREAFQTVTGFKGGNGFERRKIFHGVIDIFDDAMKFGGVPNSVKRPHSRNQYVQP